MEQVELKHKDLIPIFGSKSKVSEVLNRKRDLSLTMIRKLMNEVGIPTAVLLQDRGTKLTYADFRSTRSKMPGTSRLHHTSALPPKLKIASLLRRSSDLMAALATASGLMAPNDLLSASGEVSMSELKNSLLVVLGLNINT
jgi:hypothetical protein